MPRTPRLTFSLSAGPSVASHPLNPMGRHFSQLPQKDGSPVLHHSYAILPCYPQITLRHSSQPTRFAKDVFDLLSQGAGFPGGNHVLAGYQLWNPTNHAADAW